MINNLRQPKLYSVTLDNTSNNNTTCETIESLHARRLYDSWKASENQLPQVVNLHSRDSILTLYRCFGHVVNIANVAVMSHITKIAAIENATAIWEYDPSLPGNRVLGGSLDVIASIRTIAIKVCMTPQHKPSLCSLFSFPLQIQASGQRIEYFENLQIKCKIQESLKIPLHSNVRWGSAHSMLDRAFRLRQVSLMGLV